MSRIIRTVSLDRESDDLAGKKSNFSYWVREQLKSETLLKTNNHVTQTIFLEKGICNPSASPRCGICYPAGRPNRSSIKDYNEGKITKEELQDKTNILYSDVMLIPGSLIPEDVPFTPLLRERKYIRRALKWIWAFI